MRYCGRDFTDADLDAIRRLLAASPGASRAALSRQVCLSLGWAKPDGAPKAMSCRVAMLRMAADGRSLEAAMQALGIESVATSDLEGLCRDLLAANPKIVAEVKEGKLKGLGSLIGLAKKKWWPMATSEEVQALHRRVKRALDPNGILNPGKFV